MKSVSLFVPLLAAALVSAHGYISQMTVDGKRFVGNVPRGRTNPSIIRQITDPSPVKGANNAFVNCGPNAKVAANSANANPGSTVSFSWNGADGSPWPHNIGPMLTYMASCGNTPCNKFDSRNAKWFKIDQVGRKSNGKWFQDDLMRGQAANVKLPSTLAAGNYLIRHEIIALHLATNRGGAEFYAGCAQLTVGGTQRGVPAAGELVSLPGAYSDSDPGIFDRNVFNTNAKYTFPGPQPAKFITGRAAEADADPAPAPAPQPEAGADTDGDADSDSGAEPSVPPTTSAPAEPASTGSCSNTKKKPASAKAAAGAGAETPRPRHVSRVMRDLAAGHSH